MSASVSSKAECRAHSFECLSMTLSGPVDIDSAVATSVTEPRFLEGSACLLCMGSKGILLLSWPEQRFMGTGADLFKSHQDAPFPFQLAVQRF